MLKLLILIVLVAVIVAAMIIIFERNREKYKRTFYPRPGHEDKFKIS